MLIRQAIAAGFEARPDEEEQRLTSTGTLRFRKGVFHLDLICASLPFEDDALGRSTRRRLFGRMISMPTPEDLILFKVLAGRDKDLLDATGVVRRHGAKLDLGYIEGHLRVICDLAEDMAPYRRFEDVRRKGGL